MQRAYNSGLMVFLAFVMSVAASFNAAMAQDASESGVLPNDTVGIMSSGDAAVTGFSGTKLKGEQAFINTQGASVKVMGLSTREPASGQVINAPTKFEAFARDVGQVFGVTLDNASPPNIYVTATSAYGLNIIKQNADGSVDKITKGEAGATFMAGQFGPEGGAGTVWKIDGKTGAISKFAQIDNTVAGLGNISFDATHYQFFVSDLESGLIHRIAMNGQVIDSFDHGSTGRPAGGLDAVANDPALKADITNPEFDTENSDTWGLTDIRRRVWGLAFYAGRLYYSPTEGPQIWSVGIKQDGSFEADARIEIQTVPGGFPVSDILFTTAGKMVIAQRGGHFGSADNSQFHTPKNNAVMRYSRDETGQWIQQPQNYATGFTPDFKNASGGIGLSCGSVLWSTGDALRNDPNMAEQLARGGALVVHGLQGNKISDVRPRNTPPVSSWFVDFDGQFNDPEKAGHVGDVAVYRNCQTQAQGEPREPGYPLYEEPFPGWTPEWIPPDEWVPPYWWPRFPDLRLLKNDAQCKYVGKSLIVQCKFKLIVTNVGAVVYNGPLHVVDNVPAGVKFKSASGNITWVCGQPGGQGTPISCNSLNVQTLLPGHSRTLYLTVTYIGKPNRKRIKNCARLTIIDDFLGNNKDCGYGKPPGPDLKMKKTLNWCAPVGGGTICRYWLDVINVGNAPFTGWMNVKEILPAGASYLGTFAQSRPGWGCWALAGNINCSIFANPLLQSNREWVGVRIFIPAGSPAGLKNCARVNAAGDPPHNNYSCAPVIQPPFSVLPAHMDQKSCPSGWTRQVDGWKPPKNWEVKIVDGDNGPLSCGRPKKDKPTRKYCPKGWNRYPAEQSVPKGWEIKTIGKLICAKPGEYRPTDPVPPIIPLFGPKCNAGDRTLVSRYDAPRGWRTYSKRLNGKVVWCAKPPKDRPARCRPGETLFTSQLAIPQGWNSRPVVNNRRRAWCAKPPRIDPRPGPSCYGFETRYRSRYDVPRGWRIRPVTRNGRTIICAAPSQDLSGPACRPGEVKYTSRGQIPPRWRWRTVRRNGITAYCAKRVAVPGPSCRKGDPQISGPYDAPKGWKAYRRARNGKTIWCATRVALRGPQCARGERQVRDQYSAPRGWRTRLVTRNGRSIWCARNVSAGKGPRCNSNERTYKYSNQVPRGWSWRRVSRNNRTIICAKARPIVILPCGPGLIRKNGVCVKRPIYCKPGWRSNGKRCVRIQVRPIICKPGWSLKGKRCVRNRVIQRPVRCGPGYYSNGKRCIKSEIRIPRAIVCKPGWHSNGKRCVRNRIVCRVGTRLQGNRCVRIKPVLRPAPTLRQPIVPNLRVQCRPGQRYYKGRCIKN